MGTPRWWPLVHYAGGLVATKMEKQRGGTRMNNIFYIIGVVVVVAAILGYFGLR